MHPTDEQLIAWVLGDGPDAEVVKRHLVTPCADCAERVRNVERLLATLRTDHDPDAPAEWIRAAIDAFSPRRAGEELRERIRRWGEGLAEAVGRIVADTAAPGLALGMRTAAASRRLRFESSDVELDLEVDAEAGGVRITGQFAALRPEPQPLASARFLLATSSGLWRDGTTDALGEFDERIEDARDLQIRVIHGGNVVSFEVPELRNPE